MKAFIVFICLSSFAFSKVYSLNEVYEAALENSDSYTIAVLNEEASSKEIDKSFSEFLPKATIEYEHLRLNEYPVIVDGVETERRKDRNDITLTVEQTVYDRSKYLQYEDNKVIYDQTDLEKQKEKQQLIFDVIKYYFETLYKANQIVVIEQKMKSIQKIVERAKAKYKSGFISKADYLEAKLEQDELVIKKIELESEYQSSKSFLEKLAQVNDIEIKKDIQLKHIHLNTLSHNMEQYENNLDFKIQKLKLDRAEIQRDIAISKFEPTANITYERVDNDITASDIQRTITFLVKMNIFNGFYDKRAYQKSNIEKQIERSNLTKLIKDIQQNIKNKTNNVKTFHNIILAYPEVLETKLFSLEGMRERFKRGTKSIIDLLDEEDKYFEKLNKYIEYQYLFIVEYATLKQYTNSLNSEFINRVDGFLYE